jgi:hypothetical protein
LKDVVRGKSMLNKKGDVGAEEWLEQIPYIIFTAVVMIAIFVLVNYYVNLSVNVKPLESEFLFDRMMYSPDTIMYADPTTGIVYPGVIDLTKFTNETLDRSINYSYERHIAAKLSLFNARKEFVKSAYLNHELFNNLEPLALNKITGASSAVIYQKTIPAVYRENDVTAAGFLEVEMLVPN